MAALQPGQYQVEAELAGFRRYSRGPVTVQVSQDTRVDATLQVGVLSETITVAAEGITVRTTTSSLGKVVEEGGVRRARCNAWMRHTLPSPPQRRARASIQFDSEITRRWK